MSPFERLTLAVHKLRDAESGCPWILAQTDASLVAHTIEETFELVNAIARHDLPNQAEELGDLLYHVLLYTEIASEHGAFTLEQVVTTALEKVIRRHPHVFSTTQYANEEELLTDYAHIKATEKQGHTPPYPTLDPHQTLDAFPAITQSILLQKKMAQLGFDWNSPCEVFDKIEEEITELKAEINPRSPNPPGQPNVLEPNVLEEYGDLLTAVLNLGRKLELDPEMALRRATHKFATRCEALIHNANGSETFQALTMEEKEDLWRSVKQQEHQPQEPQTPKES